MKRQQTSEQQLVKALKRLSRRENILPPSRSHKTSKKDRTAVRQNTVRNWD